MESPSKMPEYNKKLMVRIVDASNCERIVPGRSKFDAYTGRTMIVPDCISEQYEVTGREYREGNAAF